jgi:hypothetical protein
MNFAAPVDTLMKPFLNRFGTCDKPLPLSKEDQKLYQSILISLYLDIYAANETIFKAGCFQSQVLKAKADFKQPEGKDSRYFPAHIQKYVSAEERCQLIFTCGNVCQREITIIFTLFNEVQLKQIAFYTEYVRMMYMCAFSMHSHCAWQLHSPKMCASELIVHGRLAFVIIVS